VVYCNGGNCEDSELTAALLADANIVPREKLWVYGGGITEWATNGWPVELGERKSGRMRELKK
jgi:rhodanese-related sulfurtransferase